MGLLTGLLFAPVTGVIRIAELLRDQALKEQPADAAAVARSLAELDRAYEAGEISLYEHDVMEEQLLAHLIDPAG
jgi:hypothetical protein